MKNINWDEANFPTGIGQDGLPEISECPDHEDGHHFIPCDDWSSTCSCGEMQRDK